MRTLRRILSAAVVGSLTTAAAAHADSDLEALLSESVETTSGKSAGGADSAPALSLSITAEDLHRYGIRTLAEAYNFLTMGLVSEDPLGDPDVGSRGVLFPNDGGKHVLLLLDGHTMNDQESGAAYHGHGFGVPIELIDHVEVVLGPGSVLYGSNAMFGVINVITKRAKDFSGVRVIAEAALTPPLNAAHNVMAPGDIKPYLPNVGSAYRVGAGAGYEFNLGGTHGEITTALEYYTMVGPTMTWTLQPTSFGGFGPRGNPDGWGGLTTASYYERTPSGYLRVTLGEFELALQAMTSRLSMPYVRRTEQPLDSTDFDDPNGYRDRHAARIELKWHHNVSQSTSLLARLYGDMSQDARRLNEHSFWGCFPPFAPRTFPLCTFHTSGHATWTGSEIQANTDWRRDGTLVTLVGADARVRSVGFQNSLDSPGFGQATSAT